MSSTSHIFGFELQSVTALNALTTEPEGYLRALHNRQVDFLSTLVHNGDERLTVDLRIISEPVPSLYTKGRVRVVLLASMRNAAPQEAENTAQSMHVYLKANFPEYRFVPVAPDSLRSVLAPFTINEGVEITRQCERVRLDTLRNEAKQKKPLGFSGESNGSHAPVSFPEGVIHVSPFILPEIGAERFFMQLQLEAAPVLVSIMVQPTTLSESEATFIEQQIMICERFSQAELERVSSPAALHAAYPTLREQARLYQNGQARLLSMLQASAALVQIRLASPAALPPTLVHAFASLITEPAAGKEFSQQEEERLAGGWEVTAIAGAHLAAFRDALTSLRIGIERDTILPASARRLLWLFEPTNAACAFRFPPPPADTLPGVATQAWRMRMVPAGVPASGTLIGISEDTSAEQPVYLGIEDRRRHLYIIGQTGTGKTTLLKTMILSDIANGMGVCVLDPHGDMFKELLGRIPDHRVEDVVLLDPTDRDFPVGLNLLECKDEAERHFVAQEMVAIMTKLIADEYGVHGAQAYAGPMFYQHVRNNMLLAMSRPGDPGTLLEFYMIFQDRHFWKRWLPLATDDPLLEPWTKNVLPQIDYTRAGSEGGSMGSYISSKFETFVFDPLLRNIFGQKRSTIDLGAIMDEGKILLVNLAKGELTEANSRFLGLVLMAKLQAAVMERARQDKAGRRDFNIYIDEFQSIATQNFVTLLSEGRKFRVNLSLATQFISQVDQLIVGSILGNVGTIICFRLGQLDAEQMEREFYPVFNRHDLLNLPNWRAYVTTLFDGQTVAPFAIRTVPDETTTYSPQRSGECRRASRKKYAKKLRVVEEEIARSVTQKPAPPEKERTQ